MSKVIKYPIESLCLGGYCEECPWEKECSEEMAEVRTEQLQELDD